MYWGFALATVLLGVTVIQGFIYFKNYDDDKAPLKLLVALLIALDILSSALMAHVIFYYMIENYGNSSSLISSPPGTFPVEWLVTAIVAFLTQIFYASQIYKLRRHSHRCIVPFVAMIFFSVFAFLSNVVATILIIILNYSKAVFSITILKSFTSIGNSFAAASDIIACCALCFFLASHRTDIGRNRIALVDTLIFYTVNRGILFCVAQLGNMIAYILAPTMLYWVPFHLCLSKLYVNSLLALLNSRHSLRGAAQDVSRMDFRVDPVPSIPLAVQKTRSSFIRPVDLRRLEDNGTVTDDVKFNPEADLDSSHF
ncbi:hypothetical protein A7U60_g1439 [Sanghuangporus baumii]|uniref:DUF6534 domain-containing protein n=1 Tax=Sanghuangporus baumii TaxID=108892 RepID=A0A9Q5N972_SANBA|nr:hypothetical protein A7U60_g1439 [Sanghuangporus baumii]